MPIKRCQSNNKSGLKWGDSGKCYTGKSARSKAMKQAAAIEISKANEEDGHKEEPEELYELDFTCLRSRK